MSELNVEYNNLIYSIIYKYFKFYKSKDDLYQAGYIGLLNALNNYDPARGVKFTTYAYQYIYGEILKQVNHDKNLKIDRSTSLLYLKIVKVSALLSQKLMHEPTCKEVADYLEISEELVINANISASTILNIEDKEPNYKEDYVGKIALRQELDKLSDTELKIIKNRYEEDLTQSETASKLGMTQVQVSRKEKKILEKLKKQLI